MSKSPNRSRRFLPKDVIIIHEDRDIIVVEKPSGLLTIANEADQTKTLYYMITDYVRKGNPKSAYRIYIVHRLDKHTSGIIVFAKTPEAKKYLQENWEDFDKHYLAVIGGTMKDKTGILESYLTENKAFNVYSTEDTTLGKLAKTHYRVITETKRCSMLDITLLTGRKNQIRVQFADIFRQVVGDKKYGSITVKYQRLCLHSYCLSFTHPYTKKPVSYTTTIPEFIKVLIGDLDGLQLVEEIKQD